MRRRRPPVTSPVALVTGAAKGLGAHIAQTLAKEGVRVVVHFHTSEKEAEATLRTVRKWQSESSMLSANVRDPKDVKKMVDLIVKRYGRLDVLVNTVGNFIYTPLARTSVEAWNDVIESNLSATFFACKYALSVMRKQGCGRIINFGAVGADRMVVRPKTTPYYIAKTGVILLTKQLAADNAKYGITVNSISPGILESSVVKLNTPTGEYVQFSDIAHAITFLLQPESDHVNGANIEVAGGFTF